MNERQLLLHRLQRIQRALEHQYAKRPLAQSGALFIGSRDYRAYELWVARLEDLRRELVDLCEGRILCHHPAAAIVQHPVTGQRFCDLCGKELQ